MELKILEVGPLEANCYIVYDKANGIVIDAGGDEDKILEFLNKQKIDVKYILLTHGHYDHISGISGLAEKLNAPIYLHNLDLKMYNAQESIIRNISGRPLYTKFQNYNFFEKYFITDNLYFEVIHTPGHSKGSICILFPSQKIMFTGDTLFFENIGRTDLPGGDDHEMAQSLKKLMEYNDYIVYPGHGPKTTIEYEQENNYYIKEYFERFIN
ncbi:MAG TPA: MBL fold metallo-hydrolase [bacterium]|nr:MBL fold metallo-hydrolase [bacterium]